METFIIRRKSDGLYYGGHYWSWHTDIRYAKMYRSLGHVKLGLRNVFPRHRGRKENYFQMLSEKYEVVKWEWELITKSEDIPAGSLWEKKA